VIEESAMSFLIGGYVDLANLLYRTAHF